MTGHLISVFMGFFAIMNPIANTPIFLGLTAKDSEDVRKQIARNSLLTAFALIVGFALLGKLIFTLFGITLPAFRITGGVLVALIGYQMLHGQQSSVHQSAPQDSDGQKVNRQEVMSVAISPLAIPILAGPGTIATAMNFASAGGVQDVVITIGAFGTLCIVTYLFFVYGERMVRYLGDAGLGVVTRLMGLILAVIGVQMVMEGVAGAIQSYH